MSDVTEVLNHYHNRQNSQSPQNQVPPVGPRQQYRPIPPRSFSDPTDIGAQLYLDQTSRTYQEQRVLEYYGNPQIKNILTVLGYQVHAAYPQGVLITENGPTTQRTFIPWHRVHHLKFAPGDTIMDNINHY